MHGPVFLKKDRHWYKIDQNRFVLNWDQGCTISAKALSAWSFGVTVTVAFTGIVFVCVSVLVIVILVRFDVITYVLDTLNFFFLQLTTSVVVCSFCVLCSKYFQISIIIYLNSELYMIWQKYACADDLDQEHILMWRHWTSQAFLWQILLKRPWD